eukprot:Clim_evm8s240 gene=Clim_evmTU8s240
MRDLAGRDLAQPLKAVKSGSSLTIEKSLTDEMRDATHDLHRDAEKRFFVRRILRGKVSLSEYSLHMACLYHVYLALETGLVLAAQNPQTSEIAAIAVPEIFRKEAILLDLDHMCGSEETAAALLSAAAQCAEPYTMRIATVAEQEPFRLIAHAYARYLGDLSGGQIIGSKLEKYMADLSMNLNQGLEFYQFRDVGDLKACKDLYKSAINQITLDQEQRAAVVDESLEVFRCNISLFDALDGEFF